MSAEYWRRLGELEDSPESRAFREREFPEGASEAPDALSRRTLLQLLGASVGAAGLAACRRPAETIVPYVDPPEQVIPGIPRHYATTMPYGTGACGLVVESHHPGGDLLQQPLLVGMGPARSQHDSQLELIQRRLDHLELPNGGEVFQQMREELARHAAAIRCA